MSINSIMKKAKADEKLLPILDRVIVDFFTHNRMRHVGIYPSQLGGCLRKQVLMMLNVELDPFSADTFRKFHNGDDTHDRIQGYIQLAKEEGKIKSCVFEEQVKAVDAADKRLHKFKNIVAQLDGSITLNDGKVYLIEIKSMNWRSYDNPNLWPEYAYQAQVYMMMKGKKEIILIKENKNDNTWKEQLIKADPDMQKDALNKMSIINKHLGAKTLPRKVCSSKSDRKAKWCNACTACFNMLNVWGDYQLITEKTPTKTIKFDVKQPLFKITLNDKIREVVYRKLIESFLRDEELNICILPIKGYKQADMKKIIQNMINEKRLFHVNIKYSVVK